jgi:hypothetical protein
MEGSVCFDSHVVHPALANAPCLAAFDVLVIAGGLGIRMKSALGDSSCIRPAPPERYEIIVIPPDPS